MSKTISYTVSDEQYEIIRHEGQTKGLSPSEFTRLSVFSYINKYPTKSVFALLDTFYQKMKPTL